MKKIFIFLFCIILTSPAYADTSQENPYDSKLPNNSYEEYNTTSEIQTLPSETENIEQSYNSTSSNLTPDTPIVDWNSYITDLCLTVKDNWRPQRGGVAGRVIINARIGKNGELLSADIKNSSGSKKIDDSALQAIKSIASFKPFPIDSTQNTINVPFKFFKATNSYNVTF